MKNVVRIKQSGGFRLAYSEQFLVEELLPEAKFSSDQDFASFQVQTLKGLHRPFAADAFSAIQCELDSNQMIAGASRTVFYNMGENELDTYRRVQHLDVTRPAIFRNVGTAIFNTDFRSLAKWQQTPFFEDYYKPLNMLHTISLAYAMPFMMRGRVQLTYFREIGKQFEASLTKDEVEFLSIPFFYAWAYRWGIIDEAAIRAWFHLMVRRTPTQLFLLRSLVGMQRYSLAVLAEKFGIATRMANHHFAEVYDSILPLLDTAEIEGNASKMVDLAQAYQFLRFVGPYKPRRD